jgi:hypothetical protein
VFAFINYAFHTVSRPIEFSKDNGLASSSGILQEEVNNWSEGMRIEIERIRNLKHGVAVVFEMIFKPKYAVFEKVDMGTPEFGTTFAAALRKGRIISIIHGHDQTVQQIELFTKLLDQQKEFGNDPPAMWHLPGKRKTYQLNRLNLEGYVFNMKDYGECRFELCFVA